MFFAGICRCYDAAISPTWFDLEYMHFCQDSSREIFVTSTIFFITFLPYYIFNVALYQMHI